MDASVPLPPGARGGITGKYLFPYEGDYELRVAGNPGVFTVDGASVDTKGRNHLTAGVHTLVAANSGFVVSYGGDEITARLYEQLVCDSLAVLIRPIGRGRAVGLDRFLHSFSLEIDPGVRGGRCRRCGGGGRRRGIRRATAW